MLESSARPRDVMDLFAREPSALTLCQTVSSCIGIRHDVARLASVIVSSRQP
jgi:hypothetical protein